MIPTQHTKSNTNSDTKDFEDGSVNDEYECIEPDYDVKCIQSQAISTKTQHSKADGARKWTYQCYPV
jgi:hypothetical protein